MVEWVACPGVPRKPANVTTAWLATIIAALARFATAPATAHLLVFQHAPADKTVRSLGPPLRVNVRIAKQARIFGIDLSGRYVTLVDPADLAAFFATGRSAALGR